MTPAFWKGKRVLLTGHTGFKGAWAALWLSSLGARVTGFSLAPETEPSLFRVARVGETMASIIADLRDPAAVDAAVSSAEPEIVLHMAAQALVRRSYRDPVATYATNVMGTVHLLDAVRRLSPARAVVVVTSDKCYENREWVWPYRENEAMGGYDPYSNSKGCAELVTAAYRKSFLAEKGVGVASARAGNVIGGGDWSEDRLIVDLVRGFASGNPVLIRQPKSVRPWQHVLEALVGYFTLAEKLHGEPARYAEGWNFGPAPDDAIPVGEIADRMAARWGDGATWVRDGQQGPHEAHLLRLDASKARAALGWRPRLPLDQGLDWIIDWHRAERDGKDMRAVTLDQIARFQAMGAP
ncbi:MAG TPA: CDP-glucose 4,6-dehydratase [Hyphomicrobiaceae bacterium]|nr:CDP-glucose 4,6-dehydratase [Hyphomicrobiaceae bacterium]